MVRLGLVLASLAFAAPARVAPETIQRVVRPEFPRMRRCYEEGLSRTPTLAGRIAVKFVIGTAGGVISAARHDATTLPDARVVACVVGVFATMRFPSPERVITVVYPIEFSPSSQSGA